MLSSRIKEIRSETTEYRAKVYSLAAAAAGVSMLALAPPAEGRVIITTHINIPITGTTSIDLNHDGISDVTFSFGKYPLGAFFTYLFVNARTGGGIVLQKTDGLPACLLRSAKIGPSATFAAYGVMDQRAGTAYTPPDTTGNWGGGQANRFLGVKFLIHGKTHYGWIRLTVKNSNSPFTATITEYGYETIANKLVLAGVPSSNAVASNASAEIGKESGASLAMLAAGAEGLTLWRREE